MNINEYTGNAKSHGRNMEVGDSFSINESCDDRERDDFIVGLSLAGLQIGKWIGWNESDSTNKYAIEATP